MRGESKESREVFIVVTNKCNLNCSYCYETEKNSEAIHVDCATKILENEISKKQEYKELFVVFHGGEPFLVFHEMKQISEWIWRTYPEEGIICMTTTNGTILTEEIREWLIQNKKRFVPILSIDGKRESHNMNRSNSYDIIDRHFFLEHWPMQPVKMTISPETLISLFDNYLFLHNEGFIVNPSLAKEVDWDMERDLQIFAAETKKLSDFYTSNPEVLPCEMIDIHIQSYAEGVSVPHNRACGAGGNVIAYDVNGNVFPCHAFIGDPSQPYMQENMRQISSLLKKNDGVLLSAECKDCLIYPSCSPCYGLNYTNRGDMGDFDSAMCEFNKVRVLAAAGMFASMLTSEVEYACLKDSTPLLKKMMISGIKRILTTFNVVI